MLPNSYHDTSLLLWLLAPSILLSTWQLLSGNPKEPQAKTSNLKLDHQEPSKTDSFSCFPSQWRHWSLFRSPKQESILSCPGYLTRHYPSPVKSPRWGHWFYPPEESPTHLLFSSSSLPPNHTAGIKCNRSAIYLPYNFSLMFLK